MKLDVGMYVRTETGIHKIYRIDNNKTKWKYLYKLKKQDGDGCIDCGVLSSEDILKASHNIIDLIEVGDYVNGHLIIEVPYMDNGKIIYKLHCGNNLLICNENYNIKSIVTKEAFSNVEYRVETN